MDFSTDLFTLPTIGGAEPYTLMTIKEAQDHESKEELLRMPVILASGVANVNTDSKNDEGSVIGKPDTLDEIPADRTVIALNGPAILNVLDDPNTKNVLLTKLFYVDESAPVTGLKDILPEQIVFIVFFNTLFFIGKVFGGIIQTLDDSFEERYVAVAPVLQEGAGTKDRKIFGFPDLKLKDYFDELERTHNKDRPIGYETFRGILVSGDPERVLRYFARGRPSIPSNASTIASRNTRAQMEGIGNNNSSSVTEAGENGKSEARPNIYAESVKSSKNGPEEPTGKEANKTKTRKLSRLEKAIQENRGRPLTDRKNIRGKQLFVGDYVEFNSSRNYRGRTRSKGAPKLRGLVETVMPQTGKSIFPVRIGSLKTGSTTLINQGHPAFVVSTGPLPKGRVEKREPRNAVVTELPTVPETANETNNTDSVGTHA